MAVTMPLYCKTLEELCYLFMGMQYPSIPQFVLGICFTADIVPKCIYPGNKTSAYVQEHYRFHHRRRRNCRNFYTSFQWWWCSFARGYTPNIRTTWNQRDVFTYPSSEEEGLDELSSTSQTDNINASGDDVATSMEGKSQLRNFLSVAKAKWDNVPQGWMQQRTSREDWSAHSET